VPRDRIGHTVHRNCASGMEAITTAAQLLQLGEARTIVAGGVESMSQVPLLFNKEATDIFLRLGRSKKWGPKIGALFRFRPRHFKPIPALQLGLTDPVCGLMMGATAELLARDFAITRDEQDVYALESHRRAVDAQKTGALAEEIAPVSAEMAGRE